MKNTQPAFPNDVTRTSGMTKREYTAIHILAAIQANPATVFEVTAETTKEDYEKHVHFMLTGAINAADLLLAKLAETAKD